MYFKKELMETFNVYIGGHPADLFKQKIKKETTSHK